MRLLAQLSCLLAVVLILTSCDPKETELCRNVMNAIERLQPLHVTAGPRFEPNSFRFAQLNLLAQHHVRIPDRVPDTPLAQCTGTLQLLTEQFKQTPAREFALELLSNYAHTWDPHSSALAEEALASQAGFLTGFGFSIERSDDTGRVEVVDVIAGSPAHNAGIQEGMFIWTVNHQYVREISTTNLISLINDRNSEQLYLGVLGGVQGTQGFREIRVTRGTFEASPIKLNTYRVRGEHGPLNVGYLKLRNFNGAQAFFAEALKTLKNSEALILDLRNISGGDVQAAADIGDLLMSNAENFVGFMGRGNRLLPPLRLKNLGSIWDGPLVVLVNSTTKSAAEILAGSLQDYGAIVVGTQTFGKGTRQILKPLSDFNLGGGLYLTDAFTIRPSGKVIQYHGITPDVVLPLHLQPKSESSYPRAIFPPAEQRPLHGYDPSTLLSRSPEFRKRLDALQTEIASIIESQTGTMSLEDLQLDAAKRVAAFMATDAADTAPQQHD